MFIQPDCGLPMKNKRYLSTFGERLKFFDSKYVIIPPIEPCGT
jgi:hypothetical protein